MSGFGIAGHKNNYSNGVHCGNWVEDKIGMDLARGGARNPDHFKTEAQSHFVKPGKMDDRQTRDYKEPHVDPAATRRGMPRHLLFGHGYEAHDPRAGLEDQYATMSQTAFGSRPLKTTEVLAGRKDPRTVEVLRERRTDKSRALSKTIAREAKDRSMTETMRSQVGGAGGAGASKEEPRKGRKANFTREFNSGIRGLRR